VGCVSLLLVDEEVLTQEFKVVALHLAVLLAHESLAFKEKLFGLV
jgi:hypothetical protein